MRRVFAAHLAGIALLSPCIAGAETNTFCSFPKNTVVGVDAPAEGEGYTLVHPLHTSTTYLLDGVGGIAHNWSFPEAPPALAVGLRTDGLLLRTFCPRHPNCGAPYEGGGLALLRWDSSVVWRAEVDGLHHDAISLPGGTILTTQARVRSCGELADAGRDPALPCPLTVDAIVEIDPAAADASAFLWEWDLFAHLVQDRNESAANFGDVANATDRVDADLDHGTDWSHVNAVDYDAARDQVAFSSKAFSEVFLVDRPSNTLAWRWGHPSNSKRSGARQLYEQHDVHWVATDLKRLGVSDGDAGASLLVFNNRNASAGGDATVDELTLPSFESGRYADLGPAAPARSDRLWRGADAGHVSGAQRLPGGGTLVADGVAGVVGAVRAGDREPYWRVDVSAAAATGAEKEVLFEAFRYGATYVGLDPAVAPASVSACVNASATEPAASRAAAAAVAAPRLALFALALAAAAGLVGACAAFAVSRRAAAAPSPPAGDIELMEVRHRPAKDVPAPTPTAGAAPPAGEIRMPKSPRRHHHHRQHTDISKVRRPAHLV